jgi:hypothetical protein
LGDEATFLFLEKLQQQLLPRKDPGEPTVFKGDSGRGRFTTMPPLSRILLK